MRLILAAGWGLLVAVTLGVCPTYAQQANIDRQIAAALEPLREQHKLPALAGALVTSRGMVGAAAVGVRKAGTQVPVTVNDLWHLGSDTKAMTATMIATLVEQGRLRWDTTIEESFPKLAQSLKPAMRKITVLQLLCHQSGLPANLEWHSFSTKEPLIEQRREVIRRLAEVKLLSEPGSKFEYSNLGYTVAGAMAEQVTHVRWEEMMTNRLFKPLQMERVGFGGTGTLGKLDQPWPHTTDGKPVEHNGPKMDNAEVMGPAGTVHCTLAAWSKFIADQLRGSRGEPALLRPAFYKKLHTPPFEGSDYALGWGTAERAWGGGTVFTHAGSNTMNFAVVWMAPERDFAALVCTNQAGKAAETAADEAVGAIIKIHNRKD